MYDFLFFSKIGKFLIHVTIFIPNYAISPILN